MSKSFLRKSLQTMGLDTKTLIRAISRWSIRHALRERGYDELVGKLRNIEPDLSEQYSRRKEQYNDYSELNRRALHAFQCSLMLKVLNGLDAAKLTIVDIGDSAGTHMRYLQELTRGNKEVDTISVDLDPIAIEKIKSKGLKAILVRAEDLSTVTDQHPDLFTSFQMIEHLHNPAIFFYRLARKSDCSRMLITVPYLRQSRLGLHHVRDRSEKIVFAEEEHIFELSPEDWTLLMLHSGWRVVHSEIYYQYPTKWPFFLKWFLKKHWQITDYEGFWGAVLEKDKTFAYLYQDWED
jgi:hypothetical protein